jgi:hypothetical protein
MRDEESIIRRQNFADGYRVTAICNNCGDVVYSRTSDQRVECKCTKVAIRENSFHYKLEGAKDCQVVLMHKYADLSVEALRAAKEFQAGLLLKN